MNPLFKMPEFGEFQQQKKDFSKKKVICNFTYKVNKVFFLDFLENVLCWGHCKIT